MRLSTKEIDLLKSQLKALSESAQIYLFGSRVDDTRRGGCCSTQRTQFPSIGGVAA